MRKTNISETPITRAYNLKRMSKEAAKYLQTTVSLTDAFQEDYIDIISNVNPMISSTINTMFTNIVNQDKLNSMYFFSYIKNNAKGLPELLTKEDITIDGMSLDFPIGKDFKKAWVNLTPSLNINKDRNGNVVRVSDIPKLVSMITRAYLCMSYNDMQEWLSPKMSVFVIEFYTMTMSVGLERAYGLDYEESNLIKLLFAWYYSDLLGGKSKDGDYPVLLKKNERIFKGLMASSKLDELINSINEVRDGREMNIDVITDVIRKIGPPRMSKITSGHIYRLLSISSVDNNAILIGIDYPPYFVHQILRTVSGAKHPILSKVLDLKFNKLQVIKTLDQFVNNKLLLNGVKR